MTPIEWQWLIVVLFGFGLLALSPRAKTVEDFFKATTKGKKPGMLLLSSSLVISWIFAKSITNAANLGLTYGIVGGLTYAAYYLSFLVAGLVIFNLRVKGQFKSIHQFLEEKFGRKSLILFSVLIAIRLFNEVWSNTMVIGSYFGQVGDTSYYVAIIVFTLLTLAYTLKGGLKSSLFTDAIQMILFGVILFVILTILLPNVEGGVETLAYSGDWSQQGGLNLLWVVLLQIFSYPFHDPVLTDRGFISDPKATLKSYLWAAGVGFLCVFLFSLVGVYAQTKGLEGDQAPVMVNQTLGVGMMLLMNTIMITSASSTLDSTFSSFSKLVIVDWKQRVSISNGRLAMVALTVLGTLPIFLDPSILSATTISGTMVIGLAPAFMFWRVKAPELSFLLSVGIGIIFGVILATKVYPSSWILFDGPYGDLLTVNILGTALSLLAYFVPVMIQKNDK